MRAREKAQRRERLAQLRRVVEATPAKQFNMQHWKCGTPACAAGHAASDPWFTRRGLRLRMSPLDFPTPEYKDYTGYGALRRFFHTGYEETNKIFDPSYYDQVTIHPKHVLARIDKVLANA